VPTRPRRRSCASSAARLHCRALLLRRRLLDASSRRPRATGIPPDFADLSPRELEVLRLIADGRCSAEIAADRFLSEATGNTHVTHILNKLRLRDRAQAVALAYRSGLMDSAP
jgi:DNA-binding NarL/FixJ family response regulator